MEEETNESKRNKWPNRPTAFAIARGVDGDGFGLVGGRRVFGIFTKLVRLLRIKFQINSKENRP